MLLPGCAILAGLALSCCSHAPSTSEAEWSFIKERAKTWRPNLASLNASSPRRHPIASGPARVRPISPEPRDIARSALQSRPVSDQQLSVDDTNDSASSFNTDPRYTRELVNGRPKLSTPDRDSPEALQEEARNQAREREIDRMIRFGICRGC